MQYFVVTLAFLLAAPALGAHHFVLSASNDASVDAKDAKAIRTLAENKRQHTEADATHLEEIANSELQEARKEEAQVEDELNDAKAIKYVAQNHSDPRAGEEAEDAEALRLVANQEEQHVHKEEEDAKEMKEDAVAINAVSLEEYDTALTDAAALTSKKNPKAADVAKPSAEVKIQEAEADAEHLNEIADDESREARKEEAEVQDEMNDAKAIAFVSQNHSDPHAVEEAEDAEALRLDANLEEQHVHQQEEDATEKREDADAIRETNLDEERMSHEPTDSNGKDEALVKTNLENAEADAKHLEVVADRESQEAQKEEVQVKDELNDAKAIAFVAQNHSEPHAAEEAEDAKALQLVADQEEQHVHKEEADVQIMKEDAAAISGTSLKEYRKEEDEEADAKHLDEVADHESFEAEQEEAKVQDERDDAKAISFVAQNHNDPHATEEAEDAEALRLVANQEEQRVQKEEEDAKEMREDATAIQESVHEELTQPATLTSETKGKAVKVEKDTCIADYPGANASEKCAAVVKRAEEIRTKIMNYEAHHVFLQVDDDSCKELKAYKEELETTLKRCETSPTCWESTKKSVPSVIKIIDEKMKKKGC